MGRAVVVGAVLLLFASIGTNALAVVLCARQKPDGTFSAGVRIREACRPSEAQLDPVTLGLQGPPGTPGAPGAPGPGLVVRDANGTVVGLVLERLTIARQDGARFFAFEVERDGVHVSDTAIQLSYLGPGCTGQMWLDDGVTVVPHIPRAKVVVGARAFYAAGDRTLNTVLSLKEVGPNYPESMCTMTGGTFTPPDVCCRPAICGQSQCNMMGAPAFEVDLSSLVPPFHVEMQ
jgi:hypothetical protein